MVSSGIAKSSGFSEAVMKGIPKFVRAANQESTIFQMALFFILFHFIETVLAGAVDYFVYKLSPACLAVETVYELVMVLTSLLLLFAVWHATPYLLAIWLTVLPPLQLFIVAWRIYRLTQTNAGEVVEALLDLCILLAYLLCWAHVFVLRHQLVNQGIEDIELRDV